MIELPNPHNQGQTFLVFWVGLSGELFLLCEVPR